MMLYKKVLVLMLAVFVSACASMSTPPVEKKDIAGKNFALEYIDTGVFDNKLAELFEGKAKQVEITIVGNVSINNLPTRLDKWLDKSTQNGSTLSMVGTEKYVKTRGFMDVTLTSVFSFLSGVSDIAKYRNAGTYDIELVYNKKTGNIKSIKFSKKVPVLHK